MTQFPILQFPNFNQLFILKSGYAIGAVLSQENNKEDKPIAFRSRTLNRAELNYSSVEKELLAIIWGCRTFRPYLLGRKFFYCPECKGLILIFNVKDPGSILIHWELLLKEYEYEVKYKPGKRNCVADGLSRYPFEHTIKRGKKIKCYKRDG